MDIRRDGSVQSARSKMQGHGFRQPPVSSDVRQAQQELKKHVSVGELAQELHNIQKHFQQLGRIVNNHAVRTDALLKTLADAHLIDLAVLKINQDNLGVVQKFVVDILADEKKPMLERVRAAVQFNSQQGAEFRVTEAYFQIRRWLAENADGLPGAEIAEIAKSFGYPDQEVLRVFIEERTMSLMKNRVAA